MWSSIGLRPLLRPALVGTGVLVAVPSLQQRRSAKTVISCNSDGFSQLAIITDSGARTKSGLEALIKDEAMNEVEEVFDSIMRAASLGGVECTELSQDALRRAFVNLKLDFDSSFEVARIWKQFQQSANGGLELRSMSRATFCSAVSFNVRLQALIAQIHALTASSRFTVPVDYNFDKPTSENYAQDNFEFHGRFVDERQGGQPPKGRDYSYHKNYTLERQAWQDHVVQLCITKHNSQPRPWIIFSCGAMGCGKGYTFKTMSTRGYFPVEDIVHIDPDYFKLLMPEWNDYVKQGKEPGAMCHQESGYLQELAQEAALKRSQNIWVDGSLRNAAWFATVFDDIRHRYPQYRIGIIAVSAEEETIRKRIQERKEKTGRDIPEHLLRDSLDAPQRALFHLAPYCNWLVRVDNEVEPTLSCFQQVDRSRNWAVVQERFADVAPRACEFPRALSPIALQNVKFDTIEYLSDARPSKEKSSKIKVRICLRDKECRMADLTISPVTLIQYQKTLSGAMVRKTMGIPKSAVWTAYVKNRDDSRIGPRGAFIFFGEQMEIMRIANIAGQDLLGWKRYIEFGSPSFLTEGDLPEPLQEEMRWSQVTFPDILLAGATRYAWASPGELKGLSSGGFIYHFNEEHGSVYRFFPIRIPAV